MLFRNTVMMMMMMMMMMMAALQVIIWFPFAIIDIQITFILSK